METTAEKIEKKEKRPHTTGSVVPEDSSLSLWLTRIWTQGEVPERVELWQVTGRNKMVRGNRIFHQVLKPNERLDIEQANKLANEIIEAAQNDADALRQNGNYEIAIVDRNRGAAPTVRRLGPLSPKRTYLVQDGQALEELEDSELPTGKGLALTYAQESLQAVRWERSRNDRVLGEVIAVLMRRLDSSESNIDRLMTKVITFFEVAQTALDRSADRETLREREKFKLMMYQDGWSTAKNLVPGLFASGQKALAGKNGSDATPRYEPERQLVENFLTDVERAGEPLQIKLFGNWEDGPDGKPVLKEPGIFSLEQFAILMRVRQGKLPVDELSRLMPKSGDAQEITEDQIKAAMAAGVTGGMATALFELVGLLAKRKDEKEAKSK